VPPATEIRIVYPGDPELLQAWAVPGVAFGHPGSEIGRAGAAERDKLAADHDPASIEIVRERLRAGRSVLATASGPNGPLASGSYQYVAGVAEITGIGVLPASRRRGLAAAVTRALAADALARGARTVFLSATDAAVARIYARLGFREIGTSLIAELPEDLLVRGGAKQRTISPSCPRIDSFAEGRSNGPFTPLVNFSPSGRGGLSAARTTDGLILTPARGGRGPGWRE
jgi:GNAT superfamily N-acetyltransferase